MPPYRMTTNSYLVPYTCVPPFRKRAEFRIESKKHIEIRKRSLPKASTVSKIADRVLLTIITVYETLYTMA